MLCDGSSADARAFARVWQVDVKKMIVRMCSVARDRQREREVGSSE